MIEKETGQILSVKVAFITSTIFKYGMTVSLKHRKESKPITKVQRGVYHMLKRDDHSAVHLGPDASIAARGMLNGWT